MTPTPGVGAIQLIWREATSTVTAGIEHQQDSSGHQRRPILDTGDPVRTQRARRDVEDMSTAAWTFGHRQFYWGQLGQAMGMTPAKLRISRRRSADARPLDGTEVFLDTGKCTWRSFNSPARGKVRSKSRQRAESSRLAGACRRLERGRGGLGRSYITDGVERVAAGAKAAGRRPEDIQLGSGRLRVSRRRPAKNAVTSTWQPVTIPCYVRDAEELRILEEIAKSSITTATWPRGGSCRSHSRLGRSDSNLRLPGR